MQFTLSDIATMAGLCVPVVLAVIPWFIRIHAKLEVVAAELAKLSQQFESVNELTHELHCRTADHSAKLNAQDIRILYLNERIEKLE